MQVHTHTNVNTLLIPTGNAKKQTKHRCFSSVFCELCRLHIPRKVSVHPLTGTPLETQAEDGKGRFVTEIQY